MERYLRAILGANVRLVMRTDEDGQQIAVIEPVGSDDDGSDDEDDDGHAYGAEDDDEDDEDDDEDEEDEDEEMGDESSLRSTSAVNAAIELESFHAQVRMSTCTLPHIYRGCIYGGVCAPVDPSKGVSASASSGAKQECPIRQCAAALSAAAAKLKRRLSGQVMDSVRDPAAAAAAASTATCCGGGEAPEPTTPTATPSSSSLSPTSSDAATTSLSCQFAYGGANSVRANGNVSQLLRMRELGLMQRALSSRPNNPIRIRLASHFVPNTNTQVLDDFQAKVFCGSYNEDGSIYMSASQDQSVCLYAADDNFRLIKAINARDVGWSIIDTAYSPDSAHIIYSSWSDCVHMCNIFGDYKVHEALDFRPSRQTHFCPFSLKWNADSTEILSGSNDAHVYVYDLARRDRVVRARAHDDDVNAVAYADKNGHVFYSGSDDSTIAVWDRRTLNARRPEPVGRFLGHRQGITFIDSKMDGRFLISNGKDQCIKLWDLRKMASGQLRAGASRASRFDYRYEQLAQSRSAAPLPSDTSLMTYRGHRVLQTLIRCRFSPSASTGQGSIVTGSQDGRIYIYDVLTGEVTSRLEGHEGLVRDVSWHPYQSKIMSSSWDCTARLWTYRDPNESSDDDIAAPDSQQSNMSSFARAFRQAGLFL